MRIALGEQVVGNSGGRSPRSGFRRFRSAKAHGEGSLDVLRRVFGYPAFRPGQQDIVEHVAAGGDALVLLPTGGGKSICFQVPALQRSGVCLVVSPLVALMQDHVRALLDRGVSAAALTAMSEASEVAEIRRALTAGDLDFLYLAPERLEQTSFRSMIEGVRAGLIAIDEAHCVSQWGHDFRTSYLRIRELLARYRAMRP